MFFDYDIVHIDVFSGRSFTIVDVVSKIASFRKKKIFITLHGGMLVEFYNEKPDRVRDVLDRADLMLSPSTYIASFYGKVLCNEVKYLPNFISINNFPYERANIKTHTLLWVRAFSAIYNPTLAVKILHYVRQKFPDATLTMVGPDKGLLTDVQILADRLSLKEYIDIVGPVANSELPKYYHSHSVFLNTTSYESFGVAVMEAAACGIPIVSTCVGEIPFLWKDEEEILMVEKHDAMLFAEQVIRILTDDNLVEKLSRNARQKAEQYDWNCILPKWIELLSD